MNNSLKNLLNFYINSSLHVSLAVVCFAVVTFKGFKVPVNLNLLIFIFLATITAYNFVKYAGIAKLHHRSLAKNLKVIQVFSLLIFIGLVISTFFQPLAVLIIAVVMGIMTLLYVLPVFSNNTNLRGIPGIKIYVIALVVAGVTVLMPLATSHRLLLWDISLEFFQRFVMAIALILPFEIRDLRFDMAQLGTLPQKYGVGGTKIIGYLMISLLVLLEFMKKNSNLEYALSLILISGVIFWVLKISRIGQNEYFSSFYVEAIPILWLLMLIILENII